LEHAARDELPEDRAANRIGAQEVERLRITNAETLEERRNRVAAKHAVLHHIALRSLRRRREFGNRNDFGDERLLDVFHRRAGRDAKCGDDGQRGNEREQRREKQLRGA